MMKKSTAAVLLATVFAALPAAAAEDCFAPLARTRGYSLGLPQRAVPTADGRTVVFLRSGPADTRLRLYAFDVASRTERELLKPAGEETLSVAEKARRERARMTLSGITWFELAKDGRSLLAAQADKLMRVALPDGTAAPVPGAGWIGPRLSPDGRFVAAVRDNDLHVIDLATGQDRRLTQGGSETLSHGVAEFIAAEELDREDGTWWSPDGRSLVEEEADTSGVEKHFITDPAQPEAAPVEFRYPRAGTANAVTRLFILPRDGGGKTEIVWDHAALPYIARVIWPEHGRLSLVLLNRAETVEQVLAVDPATGRTTKLLEETDPAWINLSPQLVRNAPPQAALPHWLADGSGFLWASERGGQWQLELRHADGTLDRAVTPANFPFLALDDVDEAAGRVVVTANTDPLGAGVFRLDLRGGAPQPLAAAPGLHAARFGEGHAVFADTIAGADGSAGTTLRDAEGRALAELRSEAATPPAIPKVEFTEAGKLRFDALVVRPRDFSPGTKYPVILSVYAGPTVKVVARAPREYLEDQCLADHGFIVVSLDGRGTPGRGRAFERVTRFNLIDIPLQDQIDGLTALGARYPEMDMTRVGVTGWSFGGYFTQMATVRHPEVFRAGVAGAPVVDFADYDTAYTERYLGTPQEHPDAYRVSNMLTYAEQLSRPLLIMHGVTDDNVYFENTIKMTQALMRAGKPYNLLLLPGTHLLPDPVIRARVDEARERFFAEHLK